MFAVAIAAVVVFSSCCYAVIVVCVVFVVGGGGGCSDSHSCVFGEEYLLRQLYIYMPFLLWLLLSLPWFLLLCYCCWYKV